jgi:electron transport complex protein RnfG
VNLHKQVATTAVLLMIFATIGAGLVGLTYDNTIDAIKYNEQLTLLRNLNTILPASDYDNDLLTDIINIKPNDLLGTDSESIAYRARYQGKPVAVVLSAIAPNGYNGPIHLLIGIKHDGSLAGVRVVKHRETPGLGDAVEARRSDWIFGFKDKSLNNPEPKKWKVKRDNGHFDQFTGATVTPRAVVKAIHSALLYFKKSREHLFKNKIHENTSNEKTLDKKPAVVIH